MMTSQYETTKALILKGIRSGARCTFSVSLEELDPEDRENVSRQLEKLHDFLHSSEELSLSGKRRRSH